MADPAPRSATWLAVGLLVATAVAFLVLAGPRLTAPFGDSDEGINGAVWGYNSRSLREMGPLSSRMGGLRIDGTKYANHPPLLVVEAAVIERIVGERPWSTRAPAWLGALATIGLLFGLLREVTRDRVVAAAATAASCCSLMFVVYGGMLDTMVTSLPFAVGLLWVWYRQWTTRGHAHWAAVFGLALAASLGGWQATFLAGLCGAAWLVRLRTDRSAWRRAVPYLAGAVGGTALTIGWALWVYGSLEPLTQKLGRRSGGSSAVSIAEMVDFQIPWLGQLLGLGFLAWLLAAVSLRDTRFRPVAGVSLASVIVYALVFREGSGGHQYWNYWGLVPAAIGWAYGFDLLAARLHRGRNNATVPLVALTIAIALVNLTRANQAGEWIDEGVRTRELVADATFPADQQDLPYIGEPFRVDDWLRYDARTRGTPVLDRAQFTALLEAHPDHLVLVLPNCAEPDPTVICAKTRANRERTGVPPDAVLLPARALAGSF